MKYIKRGLAALAVCLVAGVCTIPAFAEITPHNPDADISQEDTGSSYDDTSYDEESSEDSTYTEDPYEEESSEDTAAGYTEEPSAEDSSTQPESSKKTEAASSVAEKSTPLPAANTVGGDGDEQYVVIGKIESSKNDVSNGVTLIGIGLIALGVVGIACVIVWSWASGRTSKTPDEEIYEAVGMADARNRAVREAPRGARAPAYRDSYNVESSGPPPVRRGRASQNTLDPIPPVSARKEERIVPQDARGTTQPPRRSPQHSRVEPGHGAAPRRPAGRPAAQQPQRQAPPERTAQQRSAQPRSRANYDTDEIIREALKKRED